MRCLPLWLALIATSAGDTVALARRQEIRSPNSQIWRVDRPELLQALWDGDLDRLRGLIEQGADLDAPFVHHADLTENLLSGFRGRSIPPIVAAVESADPAVVRLVLDRVADVDAEYQPFESTALMTAAQCTAPSSVQIVQMLLGAGADLEHLDEHGRTPVMVTAGYGLPATILLLVDAGADITRRTTPGTTAFGAASRRNDHLRHLASRMIEVRIRAWWTPLMEAAAHGRIEEVRRLLAEGAAPGEADEQGWTALMWAAAPGGSLQVVEALIAAGADPNAATAGGWTALMSAAVSRDRNRVAALLAGGADPRAREHVETVGPLVMSVVHQAPEAFELLVAAGAHLPDSLGRSKIGGSASPRCRRCPPEFRERLRNYLESVRWAQDPEDVRLVTAAEMPWRRPPTVSAHGARLDGAKLSCSIGCAPAGWDVAFAVSIRQGEHEWALGELAYEIHGPPSARAVADVAGFADAPFEVVFRPDPALAVRKLRTWEIFGDELVVENVQVERARARR